MRIEIKILNKEFYRRDKLGGSYYDTPSYQTDGSAAVDLVCTENTTICPGETKMIPTGLAVWIGSDRSALSVKSEIYGHTDIYTAGLIIPRSGLGSKGLVLGNTVGLIDQDYQGELVVNAWNRNNKESTEHNEELGQSIKKSIKIKAGDRFAQLLFVPIIKAEFQVVEEFSEDTIRGSSGFGSTS